MKTKMLQHVIFSCFMLMMTALAGCSVSPTRDSDLWPAKGENGLWGYIDQNGSFVLRPVYEKANHYSCGFAEVELYGRLMFIDEFGRTQNTPDDICGVKYGGFVNGYAVVQTENQLFGVIDTNFNYVVQPIYYELGGEHGVAKNGLVAFRSSKEDKIGYLDAHSGQVVIQPEFDYEIAGFVENHAVVELYGKSGAINAKGEFVLQPEYEWIGVLSGNRFAYYENNQFGLMDSTGNKITDAVYSRMIYETPGFNDAYEKLMPVENDSSKYGYINMDGECRIPFVYDFAFPFSDNRAVVYSQDKEMVIDTLGNVIFAMEGGEYAGDFYRNGLLLTHKHGSGSRYRNKEGEVKYVW